MCSLPCKIHSNLQPSTAYRKVRPREDGDRLPGRKSRSTRRQLSRRPSTQNIVLPKNHFGGLNEKPSVGKFTFTTQCVGTAASDGLSALLSTGTTMNRGLYFNTTAATGTDAENVTRTIVIKLLPTTTKHEKTGLKQL